jgi:hypothetical protein
MPRINTVLICSSCTRKLNEQCQFHFCRGIQQYSFRPNLRILRVRSEFSMRFDRDIHTVTTFLQLNHIASPTHRKRIFGGAAVVHARQRFLCPPLGGVQACHRAQAAGDCITKRTYGESCDRLCNDTIPGYTDLSYLGKLPPWDAKLHHSRRHSSSGHQPFRDNQIRRGGIDVSLLETNFVTAFAV